MFPVAYFELIAATGDNSATLTPALRAGDFHSADTS